MKRSERMKLLSILMAAVLVFGALPGSLANAAAKTEETGVVEETSPVDDEALAEEETGVETEDNAGTLAEDETSTTTEKETETMAGDGTENDDIVGNAALEVPAEEVTDENEYGIQMLATATVGYVDADGTEQSPVKANVLTSSDTSWNEGWYVADSDVTISSRITVSGAVNLILADGCTLTASAGITVQGSNSLTIYGQTAGSGNLEAETSVRDNAAIGGAGEYNSCGVVTINGGTVTAKTTGDSNGYAYGAGIGGGYRGNGGTININGGTVTGSSSARGIQYAAGIGGGRYEHGGNITISGGTVTASSGSQGAGIGGGSDGSGGNITISGGTVTATGYNGAGIGSGDAVTNSGGADGGDITISGGEVTASSSNRGAGIGGGQDGSGGYITISGGTVTATGYDGAGIGGGFDNNSGANGGYIKISGGEVTASSRNRGAGIGGGDYEGGGTINISGGTVTASAESSYGAGIGGGYYARSGGTINISGGTVTASSGSNGAGIGDGYSPRSGSHTFNTTENGHAFIVASSISYTSNKESWNGAIIIGNSGQVYGTPTLTTDAEVPSGDTLLIPADTGLTIGSDTTLTNSGTVYQNWGSTFYKNNDGYGPYVGEGGTYYQIVNNLENSWSLTGTTTYSSQLYAQEGDSVSTSITNQKTYADYKITKQDNTSSTASGRSFTMPGEPVTLSDGTATDVVPIPAEDTTEYIYNGSDQTYGVSESDLYTISGGVQKDAGTYTVTVSLNDKSTSCWEDETTDDITYTFTISPKSITEEMFPDMDMDVETYTGSEITKDISGMDTDASGNEISMEEDKDYEVFYDSNVHVGTATITIEGEGNYTGTLTYQFEIEQAQQSISYAEATVEKYDYDDPFTNELTQTLVYGDITYSFVEMMDDEPVIELNETTGEVTIKNPGVVTITATASGSDDYEEATASYILVVNSDLIGVEIDVNNDAVDYDDDTGEYVDKLVYDGNDLELEMILDLDNDELAHLTLHSVDYQWYSYDFDASTFNAIDGATESTYTLTGDAVNTGDYIYLCVSAVVYNNGYEHTVYGVIEISIDKADQDISYEDTELHHLENAHSFTNPLTETVVSIDEDSKITYSSSDESIAIVDPDTGEVNIEGTGTVTITATAVATDNFNETTASYTLEIVQPEETVSDDVNKVYDGGDIYLYAEVEHDEELGDAEGLTYTYYWYRGEELIATTSTNVLRLSADEVNVQEGTEYTCAIEMKDEYLDEYIHQYQTITITITPKEITKDMFEVDTEEATYTGSEITKTITGSDPELGVGLNEDVDYTVSYENNTDAGTATITIEGTGNYTGSLTYTFKINSKEITKDLFKVDTSEVTYTGSAITKTITGYDEEAGKDLAEDKDYTISYEDNVNAGTATITITGIGNYDGELTYTFVINKAVYDMSGIGFADATYTYNGEEWSVEITGDLPDGVTVSYKDNTRVNVGSQTATAIFTGDADNYELIPDMTATLTILDATFEDMDITATGYSGTYDGEGHTITVELSGNAGGAEVTYSTEENGEYSDENPAFTDVGIYTVYYKVSKENYEDVTGSLTVKITEQTLTTDLFDVDTDEKTYTGEPITTLIDSALAEGTDYTVSYEDNTDVGTAVITITGIGNYTGTLTYTFEIVEEVKGTEPGPVVENPDNGGTGGTKTGDTNNILLWLVLLIAAAAIVLVCMRRRNVRK